MSRMSERTIDINADMGEGFGNWSFGRDAELMELVTTANVACGFHAGDPVVMQETIALARQRKVAVGAHPGFPDLVGFGRRPMTLRHEDNVANVLYQVGALRQFLSVEGLQLHHVKAHGALSVAIAEDESCADAVALAVAKVQNAPLAYWDALPRPDPFSIAAERHGVKVVRELFPDLPYNPDGSIGLRRKMDGAARSAVADQLRRFFEHGAVRATDGSSVPLEAHSISLHSDAPNVVEIAETVHGVIAEFDIKPAAHSTPADAAIERGREVRTENLPTKGNH